MQSKPRGRWLMLLAIVLTFSMAACGASPTAGVGEATATATPTVSEVQEPPASPTATITPQSASVATEVPTAGPTPSPTPSLGNTGPATATPLTTRCQGLGGEIEVQVLVGPAAAAGLEPHAVGRIPFTVASSQAPYLIQGGGPLSYEAVLQEEWGTYAVTLDLDTNVSGECVGSGTEEELQLILETTGQQMVEVDAEGFHGEYPWSGTRTFQLDFPLTDGATATGEGYAFVLHLPEN